jgi:hypothetical protein
MNMRSFACDVTATQVALVQSRFGLCVRALSGSKAWHVPIRIYRLIDVSFSLLRVLRELRVKLRLFRS